jgi:hypothetical protein
MSDKPEPFLRRWSRLKHEAEEGPAPEPAKRDDDPPPLPPIEDLNFDSDYSAFMHPKVDPALRRAALRKLFSSEQFRAMDGLDVYVGDYSSPEPLAAGVAAMRRHAGDLLESGEQPGETGSKLADRTKESAEEPKATSASDSPPGDEGAGPA